MSRYGVRAKSTLGALIAFERYLLRNFIRSECSGIDQKEPFYAPIRL
jgi:hypothetical protein